MSMNPTAIIPSSITARKWRVGWVLPILGVLVLGTAAFTLNPWRAKEELVLNGQFYTVTPMDLEVKINKDGELQAVTYMDIKSEVEIPTQIITLIPEGSNVRKGDVLVKLDSSTLSLRKESLDLSLRQAESSLKISRDMKDIQESQNAANKEAAEVALKLAQIDLLQYEKGTYPQSVANAETALTMAELTLKQKLEDLGQTQTLFEKGFVTAADVKKGQLDLKTASNDLKKAETALTVLTKYANQMDTARLKSASAQAGQKLYRTLKENASILNQKVADLEEKEHSLDLLKRQALKLQAQLDACTIRAPEDGLVIYASSIDRSLREPVQEGTSVRQSQWLLRLPDVRAMKAVLKIQEAQKPKLDETKKQRALVKILGMPKPLGATLTKVSVLPDNSQRWWNPDLREYPVELTLDETPPGLKPGVRVENAEIFISRLDQVLAVPLASLYTVGHDNYVFMRGEDGTIKERKITIGIANETHIQVVDGLNEGEQALLLQAGQGRLLLEKAGIKVIEPTTRPSRDGRNKGRGAPKKGVEEAGTHLESRPG